MSEVLLARQSIYDSQLQVIAYELLFRASDVNNASVAAADGDKATSQVILTSFADVGIENITGTFPAFINFTRNLLMHPEEFPLPKDKVVIEILENIKFDQEVVAAVKALAEEDYKIALDDFVLKDRYEEIAEMADILKDLPLAEDIKEALLYHEGNLGHVLHNVLAYMRAEWQDIHYGELDEEEYKQAYVNSLAWAEDACSQLQTAA